MTHLAFIDYRAITAMPGVLYLGDNDLELHIEIDEIVDLSRKLYEDPNMNAFTIKVNGVTIYEVDDAKVDIKPGQHTVITEVYLDDGDEVTLLTDSYESAMAAVNAIGDMLKQGIAAQFKKAS